SSNFHFLLTTVSSSLPPKFLSVRAGLKIVTTCTKNPKRSALIAQLFIYKNMVLERRHLSPGLIVGRTDACWKVTICVYLNPLFAFVMPSQKFIMISATTRRCLNYFTWWHLQYELCIRQVLCTVIWVIKIF